MKKFKSAAAALAALATVVTMSGCTAAGSADEDIENGSEIVAPETPDVPSRPQPPPVTDPEAGGEELPPEEEGPVVPEPPKVKKITYINVLSEGGISVRARVRTTQCEARRKNLLCMRLTALPTVGTKRAIKINRLTYLLNIASRLK